MDFFNSKHVTKRVHTEVPGLSSSDNESTKAEISKTSEVSSSNWPWFLVVSSTAEGDLNKLSPFAIQKAIVGLAGEPKSVKKIRTFKLSLKINRFFLIRYQLK